VWSLRWRAVVVLTTGACLAVAVLPEPTRATLSAAAVAWFAVGLAAVTRWRMAGTVALGLTTLAVVLATALDESGLRPVQVVVAAGLLLLLLPALDRCEAPGGPAVRTVTRAGWRQRWSLPAVAVGAAGLVTVTSAQDVVPSVELALAGLAASVAALAVATRAHRG
jgi:hypothetical protein